MKKEFRKRLIGLRKQQTTDFVAKNSAIITEKLLQMDCIKNAKTVMLYLDFNNEVATDDLVNKLISLKKVVVTPITLLKEKKLLPCQITNLHTGVKVGTFGVREPILEDSKAIDIKEIDVIIVPGVAYDINCYRLGYGGGFYDRFLPNLRDDTKTIGIAFDLQIFDDIPKEDHDAQLDFIITESKTLTTNK